MRSTISDGSAALRLRTDSLVALVALCQIVSVIVYLCTPGWNEAFATTSNVAYMVSGVYSSFRKSVRWGGLANPAFPLLFLGVASFSFHQEQAHSNKHTLDILGGWLLVVHLASISIGAFVSELVSEIKILRFGTQFVDFVFVIVFAPLFLLVCTFYSSVYNNQLWFYGACLVPSVVLALVIRMRLSSCKYSSIQIAVSESVEALGIAISATFVQGELVGRRVTYATDPAAYDLFHGMWHIQLALAVGVLHVRFANLSNQVDDTLKDKTQRTIDNKSFFASIGKGVFFVQAVILIALKETSVSIVWVQVVLVSVSAIHFIHLCFLLYTKFTSRPKVDVNNRDRVPLIVLNNA